MNKDKIKEEPHVTIDGWCCACGYDQAIFEEKVGETRRIWYQKGCEDTKKALEEKKCEHNMIPYEYTGTWGGSVPPPNMKCTKCLLETRF